MGSRQKKILPCTVHLTISTPKAQSRSSVINKRCSGRLYGGPRRLWCHIFRISLTFFKLVCWVIGASVNSSTPQRERKRIRPSFINFYRLQCRCIFGSGRRLCSSVVPWLPSLILCLRKIEECSIYWIDRLGRKHKVEWVRAKSSIFYNSTLRYAVERHLMRTLKKTPTIHWATDSFIYIVILL